MEIVLFRREAIELPVKIIENSRQFSGHHLQMIVEHLKEPTCLPARETCELSTSLA